MISDEAVEAAAEAIGAFNAKAIGGTHVPIKDLSGLDREHALGEARAALEAAAPHMLATLVRKAEDPTAEDMDKYFIDQTDIGGWLRSHANPYRSQARG